MKQAEQLIPDQVAGRQTDFGHSRMFDDALNAHQCFTKAAKRLLDVNNWHHYAGPGSSKFGLTDDNGNKLDRQAKKGDYIFIDLPAPGSKAGDGLEWVKIEEVSSSGTKTSAEQFLIVSVRPVVNPCHHDTHQPIAHFYSEASTSTFIVARYGLKVTAEVHGRNEQANNKNVGLYDQIRNTAIALSASIGLSGPQWQKLANGLLEDQ